MTTTVEMQSEYRNLPILEASPNRQPTRAAPLTKRHSTNWPSPSEPKACFRRCLVRPKGHSYEIVAGARRYRAAQLAGLDSVPVRIVELTDAQALETSIVENLQRRDVHPLDEATGFVSLLHLDYTMEQIAAKCGKIAGVRGCPRPPCTSLPRQ